MDVDVVEHTGGPGLRHQLGVRCPGRAHLVPQVGGTGGAAVAARVGVREPDMAVVSGAQLVQVDRRDVPGGSPTAVRALVGEVVAELEVELPVDPRGVRAALCVVVRLGYVVDQQAGRGATAGARVVLPVQGRFTAAERVGEVLGGSRGAVLARAPV